MTLPRTHRLLTALVALLGMLFMQLAVAAYACPGGLGGSSATSATAPAAMASMPDCDQPQPDADQPALCHAHCLDGTASLDKAGAPAVFPAAVIVSALTLPTGPLPPALPVHAEPLSFLQRITAPPIAIRHCCLRL